MSQFTVLVQGQRIEVSEEVYRAYYQFREREVYLGKLAMKHEVLVSFNVDADEGFNVENELFESEQELPDETAIRNIMVDKIKHCIPRLSSEQQTIIELHYFKGLSIREVASHLGMQPSSLQYRLKKTLDDLRKFVES